MLNPVLTVDYLLLASICVSVSVVAWVGIPYIPPSVQPRGRRWAPFGGLVAAVILCVVAFMPVSSYPMASARAQVIVVLTPVWCLLALIALASMVLAVRYRFRASQRRHD
jgi:hypothetical protein